MSIWGSLTFAPMIGLRLGRLIALATLIAGTVYGSNPFLNAKDDNSISAIFHGAEWGDDIPQDEIGLSARVVTTRIAKMSWGAIFKIEFTEIKSHAEQKREITSEYFIVTDDRIVLLNEEDNEAAAKKIAALDKPPEFDPSYVYGITSGKVERQDGPYTTEIELKGDQCIYSTHHNSGHFKKVVWKKGVGLVEYSMGYGAMKDGFRLKRGSTKRHKASPGTGWNSRPSVTFAAFRW
jgi:hypothetical protein